ncbi:hypothetical protein K1T71_008677 [Dendrolimus kikuchii]|uniref:Uncharacterized protein n=1 Tax=Dendrolimus kikuchii TaxID=765133 RepID=A0ACC1CV53_9NEOP|nr:hypothetical protein K1T71_008677 [Dendrolimus kikuchii]
MSELTEMIPEEEGFKFLDLGTASGLEVVREQQDKHRWQIKHSQENAARAAKDETLLPEEDAVLRCDILILYRLMPSGGSLPEMSRHSISFYCRRAVQFNT